MIGRPFILLVTFLSTLVPTAVQAFIVTNDSCEGAFTVVGPFPTVVRAERLEDATSAGDPIPTASSPEPALGVWYSIDPPVAGAYRFSSCGQAGWHGNDEIFGLFTSPDGACAGPFTEVVSARRFLGHDCAEVAAYLMPGQTYH